MFYKLDNDYEITKAKDYLDKLIKNGAEIELRKKVKRRTNKQNAYLHAIISIMALETGYTLEEIKTIYKRDFGMFYEKGDNKFIISTRDFSSGDMTSFIEQIRNKAAQDGVILLSPEEYYEHGHELDAYIARNMAYL